MIFFFLTDQVVARDQDAENLFFTQVDIFYFRCFDNRMSTNNIPNDEMTLLVNAIQDSLNKVLVGKRVRLKSTSDQFTKLAPGAEGTIKLIDDLGTVHVNWDDGSTLGLVPEEDFWEVIS